MASNNPASRNYTGPNETLEARGRVLQEGDEIILQVPGPIYFRVAQITPVLDPAAPPGLLHVHVGCMLTFTAKRGVVNREFVRVRTGEEAGPSVFKLLDAQPNPGGTVDGPDPRD
jgi:hypothetical protein